MKKPGLWIFVTAIISAALLRDPFFGPFVGFVMGLVIGLPVYYILSGILELFIKYKGTLPSTIAAYASILLIIALQWFMFHPSAKSLFSSKLANPIPESVKNLKSKTRYYSDDIACHLRFNIGTEDFKKIIHDKAYQSSQYKLNKFQNRVYLELSLPDNSTYSISANLPWDYKVTEETQPELFIKNLPNDGYTLEYIIYDPNQSSAFYEYSTY